MFRNQYLITKKKNPKFETDNIDVYTFDDWSIYADSTLNISIANFETYHIALVGYIIDPFNPDKTNKEIIQDLGVYCSDIELFFKNVQIYTGRFVILLKTNLHYIVMGDAFHLRQIFYNLHGENTVITSSPKMFLDFFGYDAHISEEKKNLFNFQIFRNQEYAWYGYESLDDRLQKLLPNHYLDIKEEKTVRIPIFFQTQNTKETIDYTSHILRNTFKSLSDRYQLIQPLTAGWDSRVLLAASKEVRKQIKYYVFDRSFGKSDDVRIPQKLSSNLNLNFQPIQTEQLNDHFLTIYKPEHIASRILPKTENIMYHFNQRYNTKVLNVNGNGAEIVRSFYGFTKQNVNLDMILAFSGYSNQIPYFANQLENWYNNSVDYAKTNKIPLLDLFYWEQRMGNWGAQFPFEQDIAVEEISPFNNRSLLAALLQINPSQRKSPNYIFFRKLIQNLWPEALSEPVNPSEKYISKLIKGSSRLRYMRLLLKALKYSH